jgi:hypothetical protein
VYNGIGNTVGIRNICVTVCELPVGSTAELTFLLCCTADSLIVHSLVPLITTAYY